VAAEVLPVALRDGYWEGELRFLHTQTGEEIPVLYSVFPLRDGAGNITALATITRDLRAQKAAEAERARLLQGERQARAQAEEANALKDQFLAVVSHELRTPLTVISGYNRLLLGSDVGPLNDQQRKFLEESQRSCQRLDGFLANVLAASRTAHGGEVLDLGRAPLAPVVDAVAAQFGPRLAERGLRLSLALDPAAAEARCDPSRVEQILTNLVSNAVKFTRDGGVIQIASRAFTAPENAAVQRWVEISVSDDGPGIPPEQRERVFEPYVQLGDARSAGGLGLGLAICRRLVAAHGGEIRLDPRAGGGSCFSFTLPAEPPKERV
jgi:signal transduction histidine kinase